MDAECIAVADSHLLFFNTTPKIANGSTSMLSSQITVYAPLFTHLHIFSSYKPLIYNYIRMR